MFLFFSLFFSKINALFEISYLNVCWFHHHLYSSCLISFDPSSLECHFPYQCPYFCCCCEFEFSPVQFISLVHSSNNEKKKNIIHWLAKEYDRMKIMCCKISRCHICTILAWLANENEHKLYEHT